MKTLHQFFPFRQIGFELALIGLNWLKLALLSELPNVTTIRIYLSEKSLR